MSTRILVGLGAAVALAVVLFLVLRPGGDDGEEANPAPATETTATTTEATAEETTTEETTSEETTTEESTTTEPAGPPPAERIRVRFANGQTVGGVQHVEVERDRDVVLVVRSDVADHVHVHGYDLFADVAPGQATRISFTADLVGRFEVELEDRALPLVDLQVRE